MHRYKSVLEKLDASDTGKANLKLLIERLNGDEFTAVQTWLMASAARNIYIYNKCGNDYLPQVLATLLNDHCKFEPGEYIVHGGGMVEFVPDQDESDAIGGELAIIE